MYALVHSFYAKLVGKIIRVGRNVASDLFYKIYLYHPFHRIPATVKIFWTAVLPFVCTLTCKCFLKVVKCILILDLLKKGVQKTKEFSRGVVL